MPISRDARMDRRRRLLRDTVEDDSSENAAPRRSPRRAATTEATDEVAPKRKAGYSQDVRKACGQRLVQLIPVRRRSFAAVVSVSLLIPGLLMAAHYLIHVTGQLQWWRHPLAIALDIGHPRSIAAWLSSQFWLLCLAATVLTFQLRRHKLDDYNGEYRLWFWLVLTCLVASIDATTSITELFALALDPWAQLHLGWSGPAVVDATLAVLIGMLGLRMCSELKVVPFSLVWWLAGLVAWAMSAALARPEFRLEMSAPHRYWLTAACWLGGLTLIWLAALTYLRTVYVEAQQRFLLRGRLASSGVPLGQRLRNSLPAMPRFRRTAEELELAQVDKQGRGVRWKLPGMPTFMRRRALPIDPNATNEEKAARSTGRRTRQGDEPTPGAAAPRAVPAVERDVPRGGTKHHPADAAAEQPARRGLKSFLSRSRPVAEEAASPSAASRQKTPDSAAGDTPGKKTMAPPAKAKSRFAGWLPRAKDNDEAEEYRKVTAATGQESKSSEAKTSETSRRRWLPKLSRPKFPAVTLRRPKLTLPKFSRTAKADPQSPPERAAQPKSQEKRPGLLSRIKLPRLSLSALKLQPPSAESDSATTSNASTRHKELRPVSSTARQLPGTQSPGAHTPGSQTAGNQSSGNQPVEDEDAYFEDDEQDGRQLSKAERKRLRRNQQQQRRSA